MHLPALLGRALRGARAMLGSTGFVATVPYLAVGLAVALGFRRQYISQIGPLAVQPPFAATMVVPLVLALAVGVAHGTWPSAVVRRSARTAVARLSSYLLASCLALAVVAVAARVTEATVGPGMVRTFLLLSGLTMAAGALCGISFAWLPAVALCSAAVLAPSSDDPFSLPALVFHGDATTAQLAAAAAVHLLGLAIASVDVVSRGYVKVRSAPAR